MSPAVAPFATITRAYTFFGSVQTYPSAAMLALLHPLGLCAIVPPPYDKLSEELDDELLLDDELDELLEDEELENELLDELLEDEDDELLDLLLDELELELLDDELLLKDDELELLEEELLLEDELDDEDELDELEYVNTFSPCKLYNAR